MPKITKDGVDLHYDDVGSGPAVLLSHSWFCTGEQWPQIDAVVGAGYRVLNLDNRGHGRSGPHHTRFTVWDLADDLVAVLDDAGVAEAVVVGLSIGGFAAIRTALRYPDRVRAMVLADTAAGSNDLPSKIKAFSLGPVWLTPARRIVLPQVVKSLFGPTARRDRRQLVEEWEQRFLDQDPKSMIVALRAVVTRDDVTERLGEIGVPTLVIVGDQDRTPGVAASEELAARLPNADLQVLADTGHLSALERPEEFGELLVGFLAGLSN